MAYAMAHRRFDNSVSTTIIGNSDLHNGNGTYKVPINGKTGKVGTSTHMSGNPTYQDLTAVRRQITSE